MMLAVGQRPPASTTCFMAPPSILVRFGPRPSSARSTLAFLVDSQGRRFIDEGTNTYEHFYDEVAWTIMRQKQGLAYLLFDGSLFDIPHVRSRIQTKSSPCARSRSPASPRHCRCPRKL